MARLGTSVLPTLFERDSELTAIARLCDDVERGAGRVLVVRGQAGVGKSQLAARGAASARERGMISCVARAAEFERSWAFGLARQLLESMVRHCERPDAVFDGAGSIAASLRGTAEPSPLSDAGFAVMHGLFWACANASLQAPVLLVVDDAHWADEPTMRWLAFLARRMEELRLGMIVALRPDEVHGGSGLAELVADSATESIALGPLSEAATLAIARERSGIKTDREFAHACWLATGGNPFFVHELLSAMASEGIPATAVSAALVADVVPSSVAAAVLVRLSRLGSGVLEVARSLAVLGGRVEPAVVGALAHVKAEECRDALDALARAGLVTPGADVGFSHPIVHAAVYGELAAFARAERHARAAQVLQAAGEREAKVVAQLLRASPIGAEWVVETLRRAAIDAAARGAPELATRLLARALREPLDPPSRRAGLLLELGRVEAAARAGAAIEHLQEALELTDDAAIRADAAVALATALLMANRASDAIRLVQEFRSRLNGRQREQAMRLEIVAQLAVRDTQALERWERDAIAARTPTERALLGFLAFNRALAAEPAAGVVALARSALKEWRLAPDLGQDPSFAPVFVLAMADQLAEAIALLDAVLEEARARGSLAWFVSASAARAWMHHCAGALTDAEADARQALEAVDATLGFWVVQAAAPLALVLVDAGRVAEAAEALAAADAAVTADSAIHQRAILDHALGTVAAAQERFGEATRRFLAAGEALGRVNSLNPAALDWRSPAALALARTGEQQRARRLSAEAVALARRFGAARALGIALRAEALVQERVSNDELHEAAAVLASSPARLEHARALVDYGAALRRGGHRREAREPLLEGMDMAARCGAAPLVARARGELLAAGARPRRVQRRGIDALTASERRIARMAADGHSNPEIAQALFVTVRTVESHLGHVYRKLDIASREDLEERLTSEAAELP